MSENRSSLKYAGRKALVSKRSAKNPLPGNGFGEASTLRKDDPGLSWFIDTPTLGLRALDLKRFKARNYG
ncbi:hypothetical protein GCM10022247_07200 [Allokutzneria multivorans]|uniref:Uncharacterized protein n=1 Tax=Allokutzneria multivorans TaxID=1142134 RepID=A0ABP7R102_9PSEU